MSVVLVTHEPPGGVETDITARILYRMCSFTMSVNGAPGDFRVAIRDLGHTDAWTTGGKIRLYLDGVVRFGGFVMEVRRTWPFPVLDSTVPTTVPRYWELSGTDWNILWDKRIIYDADDLRHANRLYSPGTYDDTILKDVLDNYCDLLDDCVGYSIERVGVAVLDIPSIMTGVGAPNAGAPWVAGDKVKLCFDTVCRATGGIYYIAPDTTITYCDVDSATAAVDLSDTPGVGQVGYRDMKIEYAGDQLCNDALIWGAALGSDHIVTSRVEDAASIALHGRWQKGMFSGGLYKQTSADLIASTMVYGTPSSKRGGKDDKITFTATVNGVILTAGEKVRCISNVYGFDMVLPIRKATYTFLTPTHVATQVSLSWEPDAAWNIVEQMWNPNDWGTGEFGDPTIPIVTDTTGLYISGFAQNDYYDGAALGSYGGNFITAWTSGLRRTWATAKVSAFGSWVPNWLVADGAGVVAAEYDPTETTNYGRLTKYAPNGSVIWRRSNAYQEFTGDNLTRPLLLLDGLLLARATGPSGEFTIVVYNAANGAIEYTVALGGAGNLPYRIARGAGATFYLSLDERLVRIGPDGVETSVTTFNGSPAYGSQLWVMTHATRSNVWVYNSQTAVLYETDADFGILRTTPLSVSLLATVGMDPSSGIFTAQYDTVAQGWNPVTGVKQWEVTTVLGKEWPVAITHGGRLVVPSNPAAPYTDVPQIAVEVLNDTDGTTLMEPTVWGPPSPYTLYPNYIRDGAVYVSANDWLGGWIPVVDPTVREICASANGIIGPDIQLPTPYVPGSTRLFFGNLQLYLNIDYTESAPNDQMGGHILLNEAWPPNDLLAKCYYIPSGSFYGSAYPLT